jgi:hypothetical protein
MDTPATVRRSPEIREAHFGNHFSRVYPNANFPFRIFVSILEQTLG